jgi:hypothetical protein
MSYVYDVYTNKLGFQNTPPNQFLDHPCNQDNPVIRTLYYPMCVILSMLLAENENLIFRGNTFATKAVDTYMKMVGENVSTEICVKP